MTTFRQLFSAFYQRITGKFRADDESTITFSPISSSQCTNDIKPRFTIEDESDCDSESSDEISITFHSDHSDKNTVGNGQSTSETKDDKRSQMAKLCERLSGKG